MQKKIGLFLISIGFITILSPFVLNLYNKYMMSRNIENFIEEVSTQEEDLSDLFDIIYRYDVDLAQAEDQWSVSTEEVKDNLTQLGYIEIDKLDLKIPLFFGTDEKYLQQGAAILENTSIPLDLTPIHSIITAHTGLVTHEMFSHIDKLKKGDIIKVTILNRTFEYKVIYSEIIEPEDIADLLITENRNLISLYTCYPRETLDKRYLVTAERIGKNIQIPDTGQSNWSSSSKPSSESNTNIIKPIDTGVDLPAYSIILISSSVAVIILYKMKNRLKNTGN